MRFMVVPALALVLASCASTGPDTAKIEDLSIASMTPSGVVGMAPPMRPVVSGGKLALASTPVKVPGDLYLPKDAATPMPAVILIHGSGGLQYEEGNLKAWADRLNSWGVAALVIDTYGPRDASETFTDQDRVPVLAQVADAYAALKQLSGDPRIDRNRIAVMGFSRGANVTVETALESMRQGFGGSDVRFAAHIALYSYCNLELTDRATDKAPMLFLHGEADDFTPVGPCRSYAKWFEGMGNAVTFVSYKGAYHGFDATMSVMDLPGVPTGGTCDARYDVATARYVRLDHVDNAPVTPDRLRSYFASCAGKGAKLGGDDAARADAIDQVHHFLVADLKAR